MKTPFLEKVKSLDINDWQKEVMVKKLNEDIAHLYSDITPSLLTDIKLGDERLKEVENKDPDHVLNRTLQAKLNVWENSNDSPARIRAKFRDAAISDMDARSQFLLEGSNGFTLSKIVNMVGKFSVNNPLSSSNQPPESLAFFLSSKENSGNSRHMRHFPQGNLNRAQVAVSMALMQTISRQDEPIFSDLYHQSHNNSKIQYTQGHLKNQESIKELNRKKNRSTKQEFFISRE